MTQVITAKIVLWMCAWLHVGRNKGVVIPFVCSASKEK